MQSCSAPISVSQLFPSEVRSIQDSYGEYPWRRNELTGPLLSVGESQDENTESRSQTEQSLRKRKMESNLLQELLDWVRKLNIFSYL